MSTFTTESFQWISMYLCFQATSKKDTLSIEIQSWFCEVKIYILLIWYKFDKSIYNSGTVLPKHPGWDKEIWDAMASLIVEEIFKQEICFQQSCILDFLKT